MKLHSEIGKILISFLEAHLELSKVNDSQTEGKQATNLIMAINDLEELLKLNHQKMKQLTKEQHEAICEWIKGNCYTGGLETEEEMNFLVTRFTNQFPPDIKLQKETIKDLKVCKKN